MTRMSARSAGMALLVGSLAFAAGCNFLAPIYFATILIGMDPRIPERFTFQTNKDGPPIRVAVITDAETRMQIELGHIDREINEAVSRRLFEGFLTEKMKGIEVIKASKVHRWQDEHPDWQAISSEAEIGKRLKADYLVMLELERVQFYEEGSNKTLFHGKAEIGVSVFRIDEDGSELVYGPDHVAVDFPKDRPWPQSNEMNLTKFRRLFVARVAERVGWVFLPHEQRDEFVPDPF